MLISKRRIEQIENILREWLSEPDIAIICGNWMNGSMMELFPNGRAHLSPPRYPEPFSGLRDLHLKDQGHHLHLDLAKLGSAVYSLSPCVCYGYRPSFELRFSTAELDSPQHFSFALGIREPYRGQKANREAQIAYFRRMLSHHRRYPEVTRFWVDLPDKAQASTLAGFRDIFSCLLEACGETSALAHKPIEAADFGRAVRQLLQQHEIPFHA